MRPSVPISRFHDVHSELVLFFLSFFLLLSRQMILEQIPDAVSFYLSLYFFFFNMKSLSAFFFNANHNKK